MRDAAVRLDVAANNVANAATPGFKPSRVESVGFPGGGVLSTVVPGDIEGVDLAGELVGMMMAQVAFAANAKIMSTTFQAERRALDLLT